MFISKTSIGKKISEGVSRVVYQDTFYSDCVIKKNKDNKKKFRVDHNWLEYNNFCMFRKFGLDHWVSPCSYYDGLLRMKKTDIVPKCTSSFCIPSIFPDKDKNWGLLNGFLVCIDYETLKFCNVNCNRNYFRWQSKASGYYTNDFTLDYLKKIVKEFNLNSDYFQIKHIASSYYLKHILKKTRKMRFA